MFPTGRSQLLLGVVTRRAVRNKTKQTATGLDLQRAWGHQALCNAARPIFHALTAASSTETTRSERRAQVDRTVPTGHWSEEPPVRDVSLASRYISCFTKREPRELNTCSSWLRCQHRVLHHQRAFDSISCDDEIMTLS